MACAGGAGTRHKFAGQLGHPSDDETGLLYMRARYMDPVTGRFVSEDPAGHGANWFEYAASCPTNASDSSGRAVDWVEEFCKLIALAFSVKVVAPWVLRVYAEWLEERGAAYITTGEAQALAGMAADRVGYLASDIDPTLLGSVLASLERVRGAYLQRIGAMKATSGVQMLVVARYLRIAAEFLADL